MVMTPEAMVELDALRAENERLKARVREVEDRQTRLAGEVLAWRQLDRNPYITTATARALRYILHRAGLLLGQPVPEEIFVGHFRDEDKKAAGVSVDSFKAALKQLSACGVLRYEARDTADSSPNRGRKYHVYWLLGERINGQWATLGQAPENLTSEVDAQSEDAGGTVATRSAAARRQKIKRQSQKQLLDDYRHREMALSTRLREALTRHGCGCRLEAEQKQCAHCLEIVCTEPNVSQNELKRDSRPYQSTVEAPTGGGELGRDSRFNSLSVQAGRALEEVALERSAEPPPVEEQKTMERHVVRVPRDAGVRRLSPERQQFLGQLLTVARQEGWHRGRVSREEGMHFWAEPGTRMSELLQRHLREERRPLFSYLMQLGDAMPLEDVG